MNEEETYYSRMKVAVDAYLENCDDLPNSIYDFTQRDVDWCIQEELKYIADAAISVNPKLVIKSNVRVEETLIDKPDMYHLLGGHTSKKKRRASYLCQLTYEQISYAHDVYYSEHRPISIVALARKYNTTEATLRRYIHREHMWRQSNGIS